MFSINLKEHQEFEIRGTWSGVTNFCAVVPNGTKYNISLYRLTSSIHKSFTKAYAKNIF